MDAEIQATLMDLRVLSGETSQRGAAPGSREMEADVFPLAWGPYSPTLVENPIKILHQNELRHTGASLMTAQEEADASLVACRGKLSVKKRSCKTGENHPR